MVKEYVPAEYKDELEFSRDLQVQKTQNTILELCEKFKYEIMRCVSCPILTECAYPRQRLKMLKEEAKKVAQDVYDEEIELDNTAENTLRANQKRELTYNFYIRDNAHRVLQNDRCIFERKEILDSLSKFVDAGYDIADPRVYNIVKELVSNILNSGRMNKSFTNLGVLLRKDTPAGPFYYANPLLKYKNEFSKQIMEATEALDRMLKTDKTDNETKSFTQYLKNMTKVKDAKKKELLTNIQPTMDKTLTEHGD